MNSTTFATSTTVGRFRSTVTTAQRRLSSILALAAVAPTFLRPVGSKKPIGPKRAARVLLFGSITVALATLLALPSKRPTQHLPNGMRSLTSDCSGRRINLRRGSFRPLDRFRARRSRGRILPTIRAGQSCSSATTLAPIGTESCSGRSDAMRTDTPSAQGTLEALETSCIPTPEERSTSRQAAIWRSCWDWDTIAESRHRSPLSRQQAKTARTAS